MNQTTDNSPAILGSAAGNPSTRAWLPVLARYSIAVLTVSAAVLLRYFLQRVVGLEVPFLLLFAAVLVSATLAGLGPSLLATVLGAAASNYFFMVPRFSFRLATLNDKLALFLFIFEGMFVSILGARLQAARRRAEASEAEARRLEQKILEISDAERRRFGQDLHDGLGQHLTGVAFLSKALQQRLAAKSLPETADATQIVSLVSESIGQTRALAKGLAPVGLEEGGISTALSLLANTTASVFGVKCTCRCEEDIEIKDLGVAMHLYRIAQEAVNNALRHGKATQLGIILHQIDARKVLIIEDNGIGVPPYNDRGGMGLQIMNFRARMIGWTLEVQRRHGGGTVVTCRSIGAQHYDG